MKKFFAIAVLGAALGTAGINEADAQVWTGKGDQKVSLGLNGYGYGTGITANYDHGIAEHVSLGIGGAFYFSPSTDNASFFLYGRANLHLNKLLNMGSKWDIYPGVNLGFYNKGLGWGAHLGVRYMFTPKLGAFGEFGNHGGLGIVFNL